MSKKTTRIISIILSAIPVLMLTMSAIMKLSASQQMVENLGKSGLGHYITLLGVIELVSVILFVYPKTTRLGFLLLCCYLGGALSVELATSHPPMAALFLAVLWTSVFMRNKSMFVAPAADHETVSHPSLSN